MTRAATAAAGALAIATIAACGPTASGIDAAPPLDGRADARVDAGPSDARDPDAAPVDARVVDGPGGDGGGCPVVTFVMDGALDPSAPVLAGGVTSVRLAAAVSAAGVLYVATDDAGEGSDHFILVSATPPTTARAAPFAKAGTVAAGAEPRGPITRDPEGAIAALRDPHGAAVGLRAGAPRDSPAVAWHELHVTDGAAALATYGALFGWTPDEVVDLGPPLGAYRLFRAAGGARPVGAMLDSARQPHVHTHWNFYFAVAGLALAVDRVRALGGTVLGEPRAMPGGGHGVACEDAQGAAFGLTSAA